MGFFGGNFKSEVVQPEPSVQKQEDPYMAYSPDKTRIAENTEFEGNITGGKTIEIGGRMTGVIRTLGTVLIEESGVVKGPIHANIIIISGKLEGDVHASEYLRVDSTGEVKGDITAATLEIVNGAIFNGSCEMVKSPDKLDNTDNNISDEVVKDLLEFEQTEQDVPEDKQEKVDLTK